MNNHLLDRNIAESILTICKKEFSEKILSILVSSSYIVKYNKIDVILILESITRKLLYRRVTINNNIISILAVDRKSFEKDVNDDWLGGVFVEPLLMPYEPLLNKDFLYKQEVKAKKRLIVEIVENLILEYPEMSREMLIKPEYFMWEAITRKAFLYPPVACKLLDPLKRADRKVQELIMRGFKDALNELMREGIIYFSNGYIKISKEYIDAFKKKKLRFPNILRKIRNTILRYGIEVFPKMMHSLLEDYIQYARQSVIERKNPFSVIEDPDAFIYIPTCSGIISLSNRIRFGEFAEKIFSEKRSSLIKVKRLGGVLNSVYLVSTSGRKKVVLKVFKSWYDLKWLPIALWTLGTRGFAVLGRSRLEREYAINRFLSSHGIAVPKIIYVSPAEGMIVQEYVDGERLAEVIRRICSSRNGGEHLCSIICKVGEEIAKVHALNVSLGDCKPENIKLTRDGHICFLDLEQAEYGGDKVWDIAEFLYYSGHYAFFSSTEIPKRIVESFVKGYLRGNGDIENVKRVKSPKYIKVFSFFTPPHILYVIASTCNNLYKKIRKEDKE
ncbi:hypothetical protein DRO35_01215 [Candidatus Bathyarchaeota archaeon]|nr:MAG: hypothetical protein DRO35_01215 [Candidatus Bathyarchaeota archaeon]